MSGGGNGGTDKHDGLGRAFGAADPEPGALHLDHARYAKQVADLDISEEDARAFIEALWSVMVAFVDIGWGVDAVRQACGQSVQALVQTALEDADPVQSEDRTIHQPDAAAGHARGHRVTKEEE